MTATITCHTCGTEPLENAKFCHGCGSPVGRAHTPAEYKQVTVLFADVVHSMDIAAAVGAERLREIMSELLDRSTRVVRRYDGTVDKFTGDGIMAVFGAPVALEDHAIRACLAALSIQEEAERLAAEVQHRDGIVLRLRVGLNSGQVIAGEIGSGAFGYTAIGEQVGMAQRMESVAPAGGVMLSASTARLVDSSAALGEAELVQIKGADDPVISRRLLGIAARDRAAMSAESCVVGRRWEMSAVEELLDCAVGGRGTVVNVVGPPGIGKSRLVREVAAMARQRNAEVFTTYCESHANQVPFHAVARLLRAVAGVEGLDAHAARDRLRDRASAADPEDLLLLGDLLGVGDPDAALPRIDPDARRRRLTALVNAESLARETPAVYVVEDAHWIDGISESMLSDFFAVIPRTPSLVVVTYRPEYKGALTRLHGTQTISLEPLSDAETSTLVSQLVGQDPSIGRLGHAIGERAAGNPFFAEEIVRDLAERGVLRGEPGAYTSTAELNEISVPATLQATIAARIDRLDPDAKHTLSAAAVIGSRFSRGLLETLGITAALEDLVAGELIDEIPLSRQPEFVFHHPLIRMVAYESQLKSDRAQLHRRLATAIRERDPASLDENAALIAEHLQAAGDPHAAFNWHMRAGAWSATRDIAAAWASWERARQVADALPDDDSDRLEMRIAARALLCGHAYRLHVDTSRGQFEELRQLCAAAGDKKSLAIGMAGLVEVDVVYGRMREASRLASETMALVESIDDPAMTIRLSMYSIAAKLHTGEIAEALRWSQAVIDLADDCEPTDAVALAHALATRGIARCAVGDRGWRRDLDRAVAKASSIGPLGHSAVMSYSYGLAIASGVFVADDAVSRELDESLRMAERSSENLALGLARFTLGVALVHRDSRAERERGLAVLEQVRDMCRNGQFYLHMLLAVDAFIARERARRGDREGGITLLRDAVDSMSDGGHFWSCIGATAFLVQNLLERGSRDDVAEAAAVIDRFADVPVDDEVAIREIWLLRLRALLAKARGDEASYRDNRARCRAVATELGFEGHMKWAETMA